MAIVKPSNLDIENSDYQSLIDMLFPDVQFAFQAVSGNTSAFFRDEYLSNSYIQLLQILDAQETNVNNKVDKETGKGLSTNDYTNQDKSKLDSLSNYDDSELRGLISALSNYDDTEIRGLITTLQNNKIDKSAIIKVADIDINRTNDNDPLTVAAAVSLLPNIDYSSFLTVNDIQNSLTGTGTLPPSVSAVLSALNNKVDKEEGKSLSSNDYTNADKQIVSNISSTYIPNADKRNTLSASGGETQEVADTKIPTVGAVRAALNGYEITVDSDFNSTSTNPLQNSTITNRIQSETAASYTQTKIPTIAVVSSLVASAIETALSAYTTTDEKFKTEKLGNSDSADRPILLGGFTAAATDTRTQTGYYSTDVTFNGSTGVFTVPFLTQSQGGNYYVSTGTEAPSDSMASPAHGYTELYVQYDD